jgi:hypothetical protein
VCVCARECVCVCLRVCARAHRHMRVLHARVRTCARLCVCTCVCTHVLCERTRAPAATPHRSSALSDPSPSVCVYVSVSVVRYADAFIPWEGRWRESAINRAIFTLSPSRPKSLRIPSGPCGAVSAYQDRNLAKSSQLVLLCVCKKNTCRSVRAHRCLARTRVAPYAI